MPRVHAKGNTSGTRRARPSRDGPVMETWGLGHSLTNVAGTVLPETQGKMPCF